MERIGTCEIEAGKFKFGSLHVEKGTRLPIAVAKGGKGKTCFISGGMHGDEINGVRLAQMVMHSIEPEKLKGTIIFLPVLNPSGFHHKQRTVFEDGNDLNRSFGKKGQTISHKISETVFNEVIRRCDFGIDCHDSGKRNVLIPHTRVHVNEKGGCSDGCTVDMGRLFGSRLILQRQGERGMMAIESFRSLKKPVITVEVGGGMVIWEGFLRDSVAGIKNILTHFGFLDSKMKPPKEQFLIEDVNRLGYSAEMEGLLYKKVGLGDEIHHGDLLAVIHNPLDERTEKVLSKHCGFVFSIKMEDKINSGETILSILQKSTCKVHGTSPQEDAARILKGQSA